MRLNRLAWIVAVVVAPFLAIGLFLGYLQLSGNFHEVVKAELYRSAQPTAKQIDSYVQSYGIRTIINLRGKSDNAQWYQAEVATARELGLTHVDFKMSASRQLTLAETDHLITLLREVPKPVLIHCQAGADRSGLVAAIYLHAIDGVDAETAEKQISIRYGHIGIPYLSSAVAMDDNWESLERLFRAKS
jgi:protein tyrosine/serine phosphatase